MVPKKPEWFELTDGDRFKKPSRKRKLIKVIALTTPMLLVVAGVVIAQTGKSAPANSVTQNSNNLEAQTIELTTGEDEPTKAVSERLVKSPTFIQKPTEKRNHHHDDEHDDDHDEDWDEHHDDERHEHDDHRDRDFEQLNH